MRVTGRWPRHGASSRSTIRNRSIRRSVRKWIVSSPPWRRSTRRSPAAYLISAGPYHRGNMQPKLELLSGELTSRILDEAFQLLTNPGIRVLSAEARELLAAGGAQVDAASNVARIPEATVRSALESMPKVFCL